MNSKFVISGLTFAETYYTSPTVSCHWLFKPIFFSFAFSDSSHFIFMCIFIGNFKYFAPLDNMLSYHSHVRRHLSRSTIVLIFFRKKFHHFFSVCFFNFWQDETFNTTSRSELSFVPSTEDDGKSITCRAENPKVTGLFLETTWKLNVVCKYKWHFCAKTNAFLNILWFQPFLDVISFFFFCCLLLFYCLLVCINFISCFGISILFKINF